MNEYKRIVIQEPVLDACLKESIERVKQQFHETYGVKAGWDSIPDSSPSDVAAEPKVFPNWQPVKCGSDCGWRGPAAKAIKWFGDTVQTCPKCGAGVVKHESPKE